jgi:WD40 repeat protein
MARVFISHSSRDNEPAARIKAWLGKQGFETPFLDYDKHAGIPPGADWEKTLYREIERSEAIIIIQTPNWLESKWCFAEFTQARALGKSIFPIIETPTGDTLISPDIQALDLRKDREGGLEQLSSQLTQIALDAQGGFGWDASRPPYPGLLAFQEEDAALYFGRDDDIRRLIERLDARRAQGGKKLIALLGASGSGKSSLLRAGVIPRLKRAARNWVVLPAMRPQVRPVDELARSLAVACGGEADWRKLREELNGDNLAHSLSDIANDLRMRASANEAQILLPIDQGEELFGAADPDQAKRFCEILNAALSSDLPFIAVIAMRSDYLGLLQSAEHLTARFEEFSIAPMPLARIAQIIEGPARVAGLGIDEAFVHQAVQDAKTEDALPLLAFALRELYDSAADDNYLSLAEYNALGDAKEGLTPLENAVRKAADNVLVEARPGQEELTALREAFVPAMVRVNEQGEYVRQPARWDELPGKSHPMLERLAKARLLIVSQDGDARMVEVAHEALLRKWPRLRSWLDDAREFLAGKQQLERDLHDWERASDADKSGALLTGLKLNRARGWLLERPHQLTAQERAFIQASIENAEVAERRKVRLRRNITGGSIAAVVVLAVVAGIALIAMNDATTQARIALSRQLASQSIADVDRHLDRALLFSLEADRIAKNEKTKAEAWNSLLAVSASHPYLDTFLQGHDDGVVSVAFSPDGKLLASASIDQTIRLWDVASRQPIGEPLTGHVSDVTSVAFSPDGELLASGSADSTIRLWDVASRQPSGEPLTGHDDGVVSVAFSPDGKLLASGSYDSTVMLWDVASRQPIGDPIEGHESWVMSVAFSHDGMLLASGSDDHSIILWDVANHNPLAKFTGHAAVTRSVAFHPLKKLLASGSWDTKIALWDVEREKTMGRPLISHKDEVSSVAFSPNGKLLASASIDQTIWLWDVASRQPIGEPLTGHFSDVTSVAFSPDGERLASGSADSTIRLWDVANRQPIGEPLTGHYSDVMSVAFSPDGERLASGSADSTIRLWDVANRQPIGEPLTGHVSYVTSVAFSPDGERLASGSYDNTVMLWDVASQKPIGEPLTGHAELVNAVAFSPDRKLLASASNDQTIRIWDLLARGHPQSRLLVGHDLGAKSVAFSADVKLLASSSDDGTIIIWDVATWEPRGRLLTGAAGGEMESVAFSPDGKHLASGDRLGRLFLWDLDVKSWKARACHRANRNLTKHEWEQFIGPKTPYHPTCPEFVER